jgi:hypothetical protein
VGVIAGFRVNAEATIKGQTQSNSARIERYDDQIKAFFDSIGQKRPFNNRSCGRVLRNRGFRVPLISAGRSRSRSSAMPKATPRSATA